MRPESFPFILIFVGREVDLFQNLTHSSVPEKQVQIVLFPSCTSWSFSARFDTCFEEIPEGYMPGNLSLSLSFYTCISITPGHYPLKTKRWRSLWNDSGNVDKSFIPVFLLTSTFLLPFHHRTVHKRPLTPESHASTNRNRNITACDSWLMDLLDLFPSFPSLIQELIGVTFPFDSFFWTPISTWIYDGDWTGH